MFIIQKYEVSQSTVFSFSQGVAQSGCQLYVEVMRTSERIKEKNKNAKDWLVFSKRNQDLEFFFEKEEEAISFAKKLIKEEIIEILDLFKEFTIKLDEF